MYLTDAQQAESDEMRRNAVPTLRPTVPAMEALLHQARPVLDHGFVRVVDYMGSDNAIVQAARVSYGRGTKALNNDRNLIRYLVRNRHTSPLEMCEVKFHIKAPLFIARQWLRHRTASVNEVSARYSILDSEFYLPQPEDLAAQSSDNKQGRKSEELDHDYAHRVLELLFDDAARNYADYEWMLNDPSSPDHDPNRPGLARELARMNLTLNHYTQWYWKIDLHNLMHFLSLRAHGHAQKEIRDYAEVMVAIMRKWVPLAGEAFADYVQGGIRLSRVEMGVVHDLLAGIRVNRDRRMSMREWQEFEEKVGVRLPGPTS